MSHLLWMITAEIRKVFSRGSGMAVLVASVVVPFGCVVAMWEAMNNAGPQINGQPLSALVDTNVIELGSWVLNVRNFFLAVPIFLIFAGSSAFGGEIADRTLREALVRPVSRIVLLAVRFAALAVLSAVSLVLSFLATTAPGLAIFGLPEPPLIPGTSPGLLDLALGFLASFAGDLGLLALVMLVSLVIRSIGGALIAVVVVLTLDFGARQVLKLLGVVGVESAARLIPWTLGNALDVWQGWADEFELARFLALAVVVSGSWLLAVARFRRMDVP